MEESNKKPLLRQFKVWAVGGMISLSGLMAIALLTQQSHPQFSSFTSVSALFLGFGLIANFLLPKLHTLLYQLGYRATVPYLDSSTPGAGDGGGYGSSFGDGGGFGDGCGGDGGGC